MLEEGTVGVLIFACIYIIYMYLSRIVKPFEELETSPLVRRLHSMSTENVFFCFLEFFIFTKKKWKKAKNVNLSCFTT